MFIRPGVLRALTAGAMAFALQTVAAHASGTGHPDPGQIGFQKAVTPIAAEIHFFHDAILMPVITIISLFVLGLLLYAMWRFHETRNPTPSRTTHHTGLEVAWTVIPVLILVFIAVPSFRLLTHELVVPTPDVTMKVTGAQWHWSYSYPKDQGGGFSFDSYMKPEADIKPEDGDIRLLSVDNQAVVPVNKVIHVLVTADDVIHSFVIQSFGIRVDAVPGRMNETWFKAEREGVYYGQCSKICGKDHAFMPIAFRVVSDEQYQAWLADSKKKFASSASPVSVAQADAATSGQ